MPNLETLGRWIVITGISIAVVGGLVWLLGRLKLFDHLPGTIRFEVSGITCVIPLLASIILSVVLTVVLNIVLRGINR